MNATQNNSATITKSAWVKLRCPQGAPKIGDQVKAWAVSTAIRNEAGEIIAEGRDISLTDSMETPATLTVVSVGDYWSDARHGQSGYYAEVEFSLPAQFADADIAGISF